MKKIVLFFFLGSMLSCSLWAQRDPLKWPFADTSIWNMPIGDQAVYIPALIEPAQAWGMTVDEDILFLDAQAPLLPVMTNYAGWDGSKDRCVEEGPMLFQAPIPDSFFVSPSTWDGLTPNSGAAFLMRDGQTIKQTQPFSRCFDSIATSQFVPSDVNLFGEGITGAHGGSGLSAMGGTLRLGELDDPSDTIRHVMKVNLFAARNLFYDLQTEGYRWPALRADGYAPSVYYTQRTLDTVKACRMGALLALRADLQLDSLKLETQPARILALAFQQYGAYVVDDTYWEVYAMCTEWSPKGRFVDEFEQAWGYSFSEANKNTPWTRDMAKIFAALHVVDNNTPNNKGGGGNPIAPMAPPFLTTQLPSISSPSKVNWRKIGDFIHVDKPFHSHETLVQLIDLQGRTIFTAQAKEEALQIPIPSTRGVYLLRIQSKWESQQHKLVLP
ncbi:MAG: T9SS type A sorting domain-containing protein [Bacteroidota bacterium]